MFLEKDNGYEKKVRELVEPTGIIINGSGSCDILVHDDRFYQRVLAEGSLGLGESYMDGWWDAPNLDQFFDKLLRSGLQERVKGSGLGTYLTIASAKLRNLQSKARAFHVGEKHYDIGNDLYRTMLDDRMVYTCGYWKDADNLDQAQENKLDLVCRKIGLEKGMRVLDIGCGWGSFLGYAEEKYGIEGVGVSVSKEQVGLAKELHPSSSLDFKLEDYRDIDDKFDKVVSLGMFEHVGSKNYRTYMNVVNRVLDDDGLFLLHTIGKDHSSNTDPWVDKYIFPNGEIPTAQQLVRSTEDLFVMEDWHNFGNDYDKTLMAWNDNFQNGWEELKESGKYSDRFKRMWEYYPLSFAGGFRARRLQVWQIVFSNGRFDGGYESVR